MTQLQLNILPPTLNTTESPTSGVVYTKDWVVQLMLDLAGYRTNLDLSKKIFVEPAAGEGAFLRQAVLRLAESCKKNGVAINQCAESILAYELDSKSASIARDTIADTLKTLSVNSSTATKLAKAWIQNADYLLDSANLPDADFVIGNPPYIRLEELSPHTSATYRSMYKSMVGRADIYIAFFEAALKQLKSGGVCSFICADRWMKNQYGSAIRKIISENYSVDTVIEMHSANAFESEVDAYPSITVLRKAEQGAVLVGRYEADTLNSTKVETWFNGSDPWAFNNPEQLKLLRYLEENFSPLESANTLTTVGIGVATGADSIYITKDSNIVESDRLLPMAMANDARDSTLKWSGHYLINPWNSNGLVDLNDYPKLSDYFSQHLQKLKDRHVGKKNSHAWFRTIDRVNHELVNKPKLYIADIRERLKPVLDDGNTYPHHNLYFVQSDIWDPKVLGGLLLSDIGQFFVSSYGVRMRGGYLRFQAQYLRRIRVPNPDKLNERDQNELIAAFDKHDIERATKVALKIYGIDKIPSGENIGY